MGPIIVIYIIFVNLMNNGMPSNRKDHCYPTRPNVSLIITCEIDSENYFVACRPKRTLISTV